MAMDDFTMTVRSSVARGLEPKANLDLNARKTDLRWTISSQGGYTDCDIGLASWSPWPVVGSLPSGIAIERHDDVTIRRGGRTCFEGRVVEWELGPGGLPSGVLLEGYMAALSDDWSRSTSTSDITSGEALEAVIAAVAPNIRIGNSEQWIDPLVTHAETLVQVGTDGFGSPVYENRGGMYDFYRLMGGEAVNLVLTEGNADKQPLVFMILADMTAHLFPLVAPDDPDYTTAFDPSRMTWRESAREMVSHILVEYQVEINTEEQTYEIAMTTEAETSGFLDAYGFARHLLIPAGTMTPSGAIALRDTELTRRSQPAVQSTIQATSDPTTWLTRSGAPWPYDAVLPGEWVMVAERGLQPILSVSVDASQGVATYELGDLDPFMPKNLFIRERNARKFIERLLNAASGTRAR